MSLVHGIAAEGDNTIAMVEVLLILYSFRSYITCSVFLFSLDEHDKFSDKLIHQTTRTKGVIQNEYSIALHILIRMPQAANIVES